MRQSFFLIHYDFVLGLFRVMIMMECISNIIGLFGEWGRNGRCYEED